MRSEDDGIDLRWLIAHRLDEMRSVVRTVRTMKDGRLVVDLDDGSRHEIDVRKVLPAHHPRIPA